MSYLSSVQIDQFSRDGFLLLENALDPDILAKLRSEFEQWKEESRDHYPVTALRVLLV